FFDSRVAPRPVPSFPTRRSSDLRRRSRVRVPSLPSLGRLIAAGTRLLPQHPGSRVARTLAVPVEEERLPIPPQSIELPHGRCQTDRKSTRLNSSHRTNSYAVFRL